MQEVQEYIRLFNQRQYFEAHEVLEKLWLKEEGGARPFYQGLIQVAAIFVHLQNQNDYGARELFKKASKNLAAFEPSYQNLQVTQLLEDVSGCIEKKVNQYQLCWDIS